MSDVFISYSRRDKPFAIRLHQALQEKGRDTWVDWEDIPLTAEWWEEIERGIEGANTFVFVMSPDSVASEVCDREVNHAVKYNKRLVPILYREGFGQTNPALAKHQWLFFRETDDFDDSFEQLIKALDLDLEYVRAHTRLLERAIEWEREKRNASFVLRGEDLKRSQAWLRDAEQKEPKPTPLQRQYISESQTRERADRILRQTGFLVLVMFFGALIVSSLIVRRAKVVAQIERDGVSAMQRFETDQAEGLRLAMQAGLALKQWEGDSWLDRLLNRYSTPSPILALQSGLERIRETKLLSNQVNVYAVAFSVDGSRLATGGKDGTTKLWDKDGKLIMTINTDQGTVYAVAFSPDGSRLATGGKDGSIKLWNKNGDLIKTIPTHETNEIVSVAFSRDDSRLVVGGKDGNFRLWNEGVNPIGGKEGNQGNQNIIWGLAFSPDGSRLVTVGGDGSIKLWNKDGELVSTIQADQDVVWGVAFSSKGDRFATAGGNGTIKLWEKDGKLITTLDENQGVVYSVAFSPNGGLAAGGVDGSVKLWDKDGKLITTLNTNQNIVRSIAFRPDGDRLVTGGVDGSVKLWEKDGKPLISINDQKDQAASETSSITSVAFSLNGSRIITGRNDGSVKLWDKDGKLIMTIETQQRSVLSVALNSDGSRIATGGIDGFMRLWNKQGKLIKTFKTKHGIVMSVAMSPDSYRIATGGENGIIQLWDNTGNLITTIDGKQGKILSVAFSADGSRIATGGDSGIIQLWDKNGDRLKTIKGDQGMVRSVAFSRDGDRLATGGSDGSLKVWDKAGNVMEQFAGGYPVTISPDWQTIARIERPSYFGAALPNSQPAIVNLYRIDGKLDSLLNRACRRLKPYIVSDATQKTQCETQLGERWEAAPTAK